MKFKSSIISIILLILIIVVASVAYNRLSGKHSTNNQLALSSDMLISDLPGEPDSTNTTTVLEERKKAPDFTVIDRQGNSVKLSDFLGKPVVLNFWASWCSPCRNEMPEFEEIYLQMKDKVEFMMINLTDDSRETISSAKQFIDESGYTFPIYFDTTQRAAMEYGAYSIPLTVFIDKDGYLAQINDGYGNKVAGFRGQINKETLLNAINALS
ncbi:MAG TPA: TlpA family protein disulfide reductase [Clostridiales bacterium]|nr:TlpA family protein disulfide reductase [Clostridiales bacterium]